ncbi:MAG TPA: fatty acid--CoA ligase family protein, partial [Ilumatobacteraceae bacterium]|nr:fatty acid--CoA ligase family protein [Ilumatobacteraceae bacterium]
MDGAVAFAPDELFFLNSTSGTTGMPKLVRHTMNRWFAFHAMAVDAGEMTPDDVFMSVIPAPFGFGLWTAHFTPSILGSGCVVLERFDADEMIRAIERNKVTVLAAVSTQFIMMLNSPILHDHDVSSLRVMFTGGEAVPYDRAAKFEEETGAFVLQFFGSNETGALSYTSTRDTREQRLRTAGKVIPVMQVRLFDDAGDDITATGGPGQPACRGPATCLGYVDDPVADATLIRPDGWMLTGDIVEIAPTGHLSVVGRTSDFIIRGGKNISAPAVETAVLAVPGVRLAAVVAMPSDIYGERVCCYVELEPGASVGLDDVRTVLAANGITKEIWPEALVVLDEMPVASGGKVAKATLREDAKGR